MKTKDELFFYVLEKYYASEHTCIGEFSVQIGEDYEKLDKEIEELKQQWMEMK